MIVSIDPGVRGCGCAMWTSDGLLICAEYVHGCKDDRPIDHLVRQMAWAVEEWLGPAPSVLEGLVVERPQTYRGRSARGDANDLLDLSLVVGALSVLSQCPLELVRPAEWKGQVPKRSGGANPVEERARKKLGDRARLVDIKCGKTLAHNVWDAVGIGLWHLGRQQTP